MTAENSKRARRAASRRVKNRPVAPSRRPRGNASLHLLVGLDSLFRRSLARHVNVLPDTIVVGDVAFHPSFNLKSVVAMLRRLMGRGRGVYLHSPFVKREADALMEALDGMFEGAAPPLVFSVKREVKYRRGSIEQTMAWHARVRRRQDASILSALEALGVPPERLVVIDELGGHGGVLDRSRLGVSGLLFSKFLSLHLSRLSRIRGDLRLKDLDLHHEDYDDDGRADAMAWASALSFPDGARARRAGESLLCLDLDGTLVYTDPEPISAEGKRRLAAAYAMFGHATQDGDEPEVDDDRSRFDYFLGKDHGGFARPGLARLMAEARRVFDRVCIYTAATKGYAEEIVGQILPDGLRPDFILHRDHTLRRGMDGPRLKSALVAEALGYDPRRVLMADDNPSHYLFSRKNLISVASFCGGGEDEVLLELSRIIGGLSGTKDIRRAKFPRSLAPG